MHAGKVVAKTQSAWLIQWKPLCWLPAVWPAWVRPCGSCCWQISAQDNCGMHLPFSVIDCLFPLLNLSSMNLFPTSLWWSFFVFLKNLTNISTCPSVWAFVEQTASRAVMETECRAQISAHILSAEAIKRDAWKILWVNHGVELQSWNDS